VAGFGVGSGTTYMIDWPKLDVIDSGDITTSEIWTVREKIDAEVAELQQIGSGNWQVILPNGAGYYISCLFGEVYFIRRIKTVERVSYGGMAKVTFDD
jgi:hypothetical protein